MDIRISEALNGIIAYARDEAMRTGSYGIGSDHLLLGIIRHNENEAAMALKALEVDLQQLKSFIDSRVFTNEHIPYSELENITFSRAAQNVLSLTVLEAGRLRSHEAGAIHLLLALCRTSGSYGQSFLRSVGVDYGRILSWMGENGMLPEDRPAPRPQGGEAPKGEAPQYNQEEAEEDPKKDASSVMDEYGYDLTKAAREGKLDPVVGRDKEISRVVEILGRRKKNNPMLIGEPGVGKSAIVEGIALRIASGEISPLLAKKRIVSLDIASVVAGTKFRGDFEKRVKNIIEAAKSDPDLILFIDEFHTIVGAGGAQGSLDAANMFKPALARGEIQCIGATTSDEFVKIVEKDGALDRRFQKVTVEATDVPQTIEILRRIKTSYEQFHGVTYTDEAIEACARMTDRYLYGRTMPDKAIDAMDEAGSMVRLTASGRSRKNVVTMEDIATVVSKMTGIPLNRVAESEAGRLLRMEDSLRSKIVGQDAAIATISGAIKRNRAGLKDPNRPIGSFLFFGPTGVGKTKLAKCLAELLFDSEDNLIRIDMSEYQEPASLSRLVGSTPGYVGYGEGGQLTEKVRRKPYCVVLFDELEKAHPQVFNMLLQVLDDARLTDGEGRTVSFKNTIIIMTSNVGSRDLEEYGKGIGFASSAKDVEKNREKVLEKAIKNTFPPEFMGRIDEKVYFHGLGKSEIEKIVDIEIASLAGRVKEAGFELRVTPAAKRLVADAGFDPAFGARPLKRAVTKYIEDPVSEFIIAEKMLPAKARKAAGGVIRVGVSKDKESTVVAYA